MRFGYIILLVVALMVPGHKAYADCPAISNAKFMKVTWDADGNGALQAVTGTAGASAEGAVIFDASDKKLKICDGSNWLVVISGNDSGAVTTYTMSINTSAPVACTAANRGQIALNNVNNLLVGPSLCVCSLGGWKKMDGLGTPCVWNLL